MIHALPTETHTDIASAPAPGIRPTVGIPAKIHAVETGHLVVLVDGGVGEGLGGGGGGR